MEIALLYGESRPLRQRGSCPNLALRSWRATLEYYMMIATEIGGDYFFMIEHARLKVLQGVQLVLPSADGC